LPDSFTFVDEVLKKHDNKKSALIAVLQDIQQEYKYLPVDVLMHVSKAMDVTPSKIYSVATFYENFSLEPKGKYIIKICDGTACHVKKSEGILAVLEKELGLNKENKTTKDMLFTLETVACLGACGLAPVVVIDDKVHGLMTPATTLELLNKIREEEGLNV
jgi:NADH-quinone oxidoreductase subunit E